ncbi:MAG: hypothetical protein M0P14_04290, partial [Alkaliphilus sp.]|nr:hypothetical protein [Alkaliphilus sp.]
NSKGTREFIDILKLTEEYGLDAIGKILKKLNEMGQYSYQTVLSLIRCQTECTGGTQPLAEEYLNALNISNIKTSYLPLTTYNNLIKEEGCLQ